MSRKDIFKSFNKDMTVPEIKDIANYNSKILSDIRCYLNEAGKKALEAYDVLEFEATFASTTDELVEGIESHINRRDSVYNVSKEAANNLKHFCKNFLDREITIKEERS